MSFGNYISKAISDFDDDDPDSSSDVTSQNKRLCGCRLESDQIRGGYEEDW